MTEPQPNHIVNNVAEMTEHKKLKANPSTGRTELVWEGKGTQVERIPLKVIQKVKKWSDYIDYWAVEWDSLRQAQRRTKKTLFTTSGSNIAPENTQRWLTKANGITTPVLALINSL